MSSSRSPTLSSWLTKVGCQDNPRSSAFLYKDDMLCEHREEEEGEERDLHDKSILAVSQKTPSAWKVPYRVKLIEET